MKTRLIPYTSLKPSTLCLGTGDMGGSLDQSTSFALLDAFLNAGGTFIDTAKVYADWLPGERSSSEKTIGHWLQSRGCRDQVILATKGAHPDLATMHIPRLSAQEITADAEASLRHLGVERIELYYLHRDDPSRPVIEILGALEGLVRAGKIAYYACSNWQTERIREAQAIAHANGMQGFSADQPLWNLARVTYDHLSDPTLAVMDASLFTFHRETGMACVPFSSQANGFFQKLETGSAGRMEKSQQSMYQTAENQARFERLQEVKRRSGLSTTQIVLGYLFSQPFAVFPVIGPKSLAQLADSLTSADVQLSEGDVLYLESGL